MSCVQRGEFKMRGRIIGEKRERDVVEWPSLAGTKTEDAALSNSGASEAPVELSTRAEGVLLCGSDVLEHPNKIVLKTLQHARDQALENIALLHIFAFPIESKKA